MIHDLGCGTGAYGPVACASAAGAAALGSARPGRGSAGTRDRRASRAGRRRGNRRRSKRSPPTSPGWRPAISRGASLITASALLDLLTAEELAALVTVCAGAGCPMLLTLSVAGRVELTPADPLDRRVAAAFDAHQRRATERGRLLGPDAVALAVQEFGRLGAEVFVRPSPWRLGASEAGLAAEWFIGWVGPPASSSPSWPPRPMTIDAGGWRRQRSAGSLSGSTTPTCWPCPDRVSSCRHRDVERVGAPSRLRREIASVRGGQVHARRHTRGHRYPEPAQLPRLVRVVAEQATRETPSACNICAATR